ncbi:unnamed protein product [Acanthoscelides obtectus]|uniref:Uncharacterized protein n=1 Tax=Acanthoscelides obtectus TaxID=200917 RepID=A0A9P0KPG0_ACAOB|nr:unnamed protein product [Acanthoscelides obtectus]CAK1650025.1 hypothetical protein AOBTE_LOCUS16551 [Acanthoscelides obtectus]
MREDGNRKLQSSAVPTIFSFTKAKPKRKPPTQREVPASITPVVVDNEEEIVDPTPTKKMKVALLGKSHSFDSSESQVYDADRAKKNSSDETIMSGSSVIWNACLKNSLTFVLKIFI